jgi:SAM-dependent methyltransferase
VTAVRDYPQRALRQAIGDALGDLVLEPGGRVLDYGCTAVWARSALPPDAEYVGAELPIDPAGAIVPAQPLSDGAAFDAVVSIRALDRAAYPQRYLAECHRALRTGGRLILAAGSIAPRAGLDADYWRWTSAGLRKTVEQAGFRVERITGVVGLAAAGLALICEGVGKRLPRPPRAVLFACLAPALALVDRFEPWGGREANAMHFVAVAHREG